MKPKSEHADKTESIVSANFGQSEIRVQHISYSDLFFSFCFAFRREGLNRRPSDRVYSLTLTFNELKTRFNSIENKS